MKYIFPRHIFIYSFTFLLAIVAFNVTPNTLTIDNCEASTASGCVCKNAPYPPGKAGELERKQDLAKCPHCVPLRDKFGKGLSDAQSLQVIMNAAAQLLKQFTSGGGAAGGSGAGTGATTGIGTDPYGNPYGSYDQYGNYIPPYTPQTAINDLYNDFGTVTTTTNPTTNITDFFDPAGTSTQGGDTPTGTDGYTQPGALPQMYFCPSGNCATPTSGETGEGGEGSEVDTTGEGTSPTAVTQTNSAQNTSANTNNVANQVLTNTPQATQPTSLADRVLNFINPSQQTETPSNPGNTGFDSSNPQGTQGLNGTQSNQPLANYQGAPASGQPLVGSVDTLPEQEFSWREVESVDPGFSLYLQNFIRRWGLIAPFPLSNLPTGL